MPLSSPSFPLCLLAFSLLLTPPSHLEGGWVSDLDSCEIQERQKKCFYPFQLPCLDLETTFHFLNQTFYHPNNRFYETAPFPFPSSLQRSLMEDYLNEADKLKKDSFVPPQKPGKVDAILYCQGTPGMRVRLRALKKSIALGWKFRTVHLLTRSQVEKEEYLLAIEEAFLHHTSRPNFEFTLTHQLVNGLERGCKLLVLQDRIAPYHLVIETSDLLAPKQEGRCREAFLEKSICLGSNIFPIRSWKEEIKIYGYEDQFGEEESLCRWFHSHMQLLARKVHYEFIHREELQLEEQQIARAIHQSPSTVEERIQLFAKLAHNYYERALCSAQEEFVFATHLLRSVGILEYIQNLSSSFSIDPWIHQSFLALNQMSTTEGAWNALLTRTPFHKQALHKLREQVQEKLLSKELSTKDLFIFIQNQRDALVTDIVEHAVTVLGPPPCSFSLICYGSNARKEATPYSDLEFGVLYEEASETNRSYFQTLSTAILMQVLNLSETILFQLNLPCFAEPYQGEKKYAQWFLDDVTTRGFSIDLLDHPRISKLPISSKKTIPLFGTHRELAQKMLTLSQKEYFGYSNLSERLLYGSATLFSRYLEEKSQLFSSEKMSLFLTTFQGILDDYSIAYKRSWDGKWDLKNTFLRLITHGVEALSDFYALSSLNSFDRIEELKQKGHLSASEAEVLLTYLEQAFLARLTVQMKREGQYEGISEIDLSFYSELVTNKEKVLALLKRKLDKIKLEGELPDSSR